MFEREIIDPHRILTVGCDLIGSLIDDGHSEIREARHHRCQRNTRAATVELEFERARQMSWLAVCTQAEVTVGSERLDLFDIGRCRSGIERSLIAGPERISIDVTETERLVLSKLVDQRFGEVVVPYLDKGLDPILGVDRMADT